MNTQILLLLAIVPVAQLQSTLNVGAAGELPDGSSASGEGLAVGSNVEGTVGLSVEDTVSRSSVVLSASGSSTPKLQTQTSAITIATKPTYNKVPVHVPQKVYVIPQPKCEDLEDDKCYEIHEYKKCGYCILSKYPTKGFGCSYTEEVALKKKGDNKKEYEYETEIVPKCDCDGVYILDKHACPSCDSLLKEILACAGAASKSGEIEIPAGCLKKVGVTEKELIKCGYLTKPKPETAAVKKEKEASKPTPKPIIIKKEKVTPKPSSKHIIAKKENPKVVVVSKPTSATAIASASASAQGKGSTAIATATATATSSKHH